MNMGVPILLERDNVNDDVVVLSHCFVKDGEMVESGRLIAEIETSKANVEVLAPEAGYLYWRFVEKEEISLSEPIGHILPEPVPVGSLLVSSPKSSAASSEHGSTSISPAVAVIDVPPAGGKYDQTSGDGGEKTRLIFSSLTSYTQQISRSAQELMKAHNISEKHFSGMALVRVEDVLAIVHGKPIAPASPVRKESVPGKTAEGKLAREQSSVPVTEVPLSRMKKSEGRSLAEGAKNTIPSSASVTCLTHGLRTALESDAVVAGSLGALVIYEAARLLRKYPSFNANHRSGVMLRYEQVNIGYAVDDGRGLKVVVLRDCDQKSLGEITAELRDLVFAYLEDKLTPAQISDGTFTISDLSGSGVSSFVPLISEGQGAILGVGSEQFIPGSKDGFYTLTLGFDHQLSEGRTAALFLNDLKDRLLHYEKAIVKDLRDTEIISCARCGRGSADLPDEKSYMVRSAVPPGYLCNLCMAGL